MKKFGFLLIAMTVVLWGCSSGEPAADTSTSSKGGPPPADQGSGGTPAPTVAAASFASVKDIINANCVTCHGDTNPKNGLSFTKDEVIMSVVTPGDPENSKIIKALHGNGMKQMPPNNPLPDDKIKTIEEWIKAGAKSS